MCIRDRGKPYSINRVDKILTALDTISTNDQFESVKSTVEENLFENKINLKFTIKETEKIYVEKINILGNNITRESVLRNQLEVDEGDPYNEILLTKSINNLRALNFFKTSSISGGLLFPPQGSLSLLFPLSFHDICLFYVVSL